MKFKQWVICFLVTVLLASFSSAVIGQNASSSREDQRSLENKAKKDKKQIDCRKIRTTRSRIKRTICLTELEWQRIEESSQLLSRELYSS